jgi:hypothetical protein
MIQNLAVPAGSIHGGDYARRGLLTGRTAHLDVEIRKRRD